MAVLLWGGAPHFARYRRFSIFAEARADYPCRVAKLETLLRRSNFFGKEQNARLLHLNISSLATEDAWPLFSRSASSVFLSFLPFFLLFLF